LLFDAGAVQLVVRLQPRPHALCQAIASLILRELSLAGEPLPSSASAAEEGQGPGGAGPAAPFPEGAAPLLSLLEFVSESGGSVEAEEAAAFGREIADDGMDEKTLEGFVRLVAEQGMSSR
jgi:hypothetical protein